MQMRNEVNDLDAQRAFEGDDRDEEMDDDLEALGGTEEDLELSALREMIADAVEFAAEERGTSASAVMRLSGVLTDNLDEPLVEEFNRSELLHVIRFIARENPDALEKAIVRHPATEDALADILVDSGSI